MGKIIRLTVACLVVLGIAGAVIPLYAQVKVEEKAVSISGEVVSVDLVKSEIVVKQLKDAVTSAYENTAISISTETKIQKGELALKLSDLKAGDKVMVAYASDAEGMQQVKSIEVMAK